MYKVILWLKWAYPHKKWENWVFAEWVQGWLNEEEHKRLLEMLEFLRKKAMKNLEMGRIKIPGRNPKQEHFMYYQKPQYWDIVFEEENIRELYRKETGEDIPEPVRSYLFDTKTYEKVYLKNKRETGDWFGKGERKVRKK